MSSHPAIEPLAVAARRERMAVDPLTIVDHNTPPEGWEAWAEREAERDTNEAMPSGDHLREISLAGFMQADASCIRYAVHPTVPRNVLTLVPGHGGAGKSNLINTCAAHWANGCAWAGMQPDGIVRTLIVSLEDPGDLIRYRLRRICESYPELDPAKVEANVRILDGSGGDASLMVEVNALGVRQLSITPLMGEVEDAAAGADIIVIDNASDAFSGNENERRGVRTFLRRLTDIARKHDAGLVLLAHIDKAAARHGANGNSYSGSTAWHNSARSRLALVLQDDGSIELVHEKNNLGKCADSVRLAWNDRGVLVPQAYDPEAAEEEASDDRAAALHALHAASLAGITVPTGTSGPATAWHALEPVQELAQQFRNKGGKRRLFAALLALQRQDLIVRKDFRTSARNTRQCWELTQAGSERARESAPTYTPNTPLRTNARAGSALVGAVQPTNATHATHAAGYRSARDDNA